MSDAPDDQGSPEPELLDHDYDGIQEYDNPLPFWWKGIFVLTVAHAAAYLYWYHGGGPGPTMHEEYVAEVKALDAKRAAAPTEAIVVDEDILASMARDRATVERGHDVFVKNCASCHTENGRGLVGPNLTDRFQLHGKSRMDLYNTISNGVVDKGMLAWAPILKPDELAAAAVFVTTLRGQDVPGKGPEGQPVDPFTN